VRAGAMVTVPSSCNSCANKGRSMRVPAPVHSMAAGARGYFVGHRSAAVGFQGTITRAAASTHAYRFELCLIDSWRAHLRDRDATALRKIKPYASE
jgi:hypothetical protein